MEEEWRKGIKMFDVIKGEEPEEKNGKRGLKKKARVKKQVRRGMESLGFEWLRRKNFKTKWGLRD